jgi:hypothetical protein
MGMDTAKKILDSISHDYSLSDSEIARRVGTSQPTIFRIRSGADCFASLYIAICEFRDTLRGKKRKAVREMTISNRRSDTCPPQVMLERRIKS